MYPQTNEPPKGEPSPFRAGRRSVPEQAAEKREGCGIQASMSLDLMVRAVKIALETTMELIDKPDEKHPA